MQPVDRYRITRPFADPGSYASRSDSHGRAGHHTGIDYGKESDAVPIDGRTVRTIVPGEVVISGYNSTMGNWVGVWDARTDLLVTYWHLADRSVSLGQHVALGAPVGRVGNTGNSSAPHLHMQCNRGRTFSYHGHIDPAVAINAYQQGGAPVATVFGIDGARYQKDLSLRSVVEQGYDFIIIKATEGRRYVSPTWVAQRDAALKTRALFAAYHWLRSDSSPAQQADNIARTLGDKSIPVFIDCEPAHDPVTGRIVSRPTLPMCVEFREECRKRGVRVTGLYLPEWWWREIGRPSLKGWILWESQYGDNPRGYGSAIYPGNGSERWNEFGGVTPTLLQFGSRGKLDGYPRDVDVNAFRGTLAELKALNLFRDPNPTPPPPPPPAPGPKPERVLLANVGITTKAWKVFAAVIWWMTRYDADILFLVETSEKHRGMLKRLGRARVVEHQPGESWPDKNECTVIVRKRLSNAFRAWGIRCTKTWWGHKARRKHDPRTSVVLTLGAEGYGVGHRPPGVDYDGDGTPEGKADRVAADIEWAQIHTKALKGWNEAGRPWLFAADWNEQAERDGMYSPRWMAEQLDAQIASAGGIDYFMARGLRVVNVRQHWNRLAADHKVVTADIKR